MSGGPTSQSCLFGRISIAAVTPFLAPTETDSSGITKQSIDKECFSETISFVAAGLSSARLRLSRPEDVGGIIIPGTTGEQHSLSVDEKNILFKLACAAAAPFDVNIFAGVAATTTYEACELAKHAVSVGCRGLMLGLPPYIKANDAEMTSYVEAVYNAVPSHCPILLYNNVNRNGCGASLEALVSWYRRGLICGIKHANAPISVFLEESKTLLAMEPSLRLYTGSDVLARALLTGESGEAAAVEEEVYYPRFYGLTSIVGNLYPEDTALMITGLVSGKGSNAQDEMSSSTHPLSLAKAEALHNDLSNVASACLVNISLPVGLKYAMRKKSSDKLGGWARLPLESISEAKMDEVDKAIAVFNEKKSGSSTTPSTI